ncbi:MAG: outer membrane protein transport protein, partial [Myxococcales bacterium]|nr:outer membrane protein transport protein [Myxococcales bacterium]
LTRLESIDYTTPQFYMYQNLPDKLIIAMGVAYEIHRVISVGIGFQLLAKLSGTADFSISLLDKRINKKNLKVDLFATIAPTAGILLRPVRGLRIGISYRGALQLSFSLPLNVVLDEIGALDFKIKGVGLYTPHQINFGVSYEFRYPKIRISAGVTWAMWSRAPSPSAAIDIKLDDTKLNPNAPTPASIIDVHSPNVKLNAKDILIPRVGIEYVVLEWLTLRGGYFYRPTPLPNQVYETNYIDNEAHTISLGAGFAWYDKFERTRGLVVVDLVGQLTILMPRSIGKVLPNDPVGGYTSKGVIFNLGIEFRHDF